jgi:hypothetical protein
VVTYEAVVSGRRGPFLASRPRRADPDHPEEWATLPEVIKGDTRWQEALAKRSVTAAVSSAR